MRISELYAPHGPYVGQDFIICGCGPSLGVVPKAFLHDRLVLALNDTCRHLPGVKCVGFANNRDHFKFATDLVSPRIVKGRLKWKSPSNASDDPSEDDNHVRWEDPDFFVYSYREPPWDKVSHHDESTLWQEPCHYYAPVHGSISAFACQFAIHAGARSILLIGCDCGTLGEQHYISGKKDHQSRHDYEQYAKGLKVMQREAHKRGIPLLSLQPFVGVGDYDGQFRDLQKWQRTHPFGGP